MKMKLPLKLLIAFVIALAGLQSAGYDWAYCRKALLKRCKIAVTRVELTPRVESLASGVTEGSVMLAVTNPYPVSLSLTSADFKLFTGAKEIGQARLQGAAVALPGRSTTEVPVTVQIDVAAAIPEVTDRMANSLGNMRLRDIGAMMKDLGTGQSRGSMKDVPLDLRAEGEAVFNTPVGSGISVPVKAARKGSAPDAGEKPAATGETRQW